MIEKQNPPQDTGPPVSPDDAAPRKPYDPPRVVSHNAIEVITAACTPVPPGKQSGPICTVSSS